MQKSGVSTKILTKIYRPWLKECDYHKIQQYSDQTNENCFYIVNPSSFKNLNKELKRFFKFILYCSLKSIHKKYKIEKHVLSTYQLNNSWMEYFIKYFMHFIVSTSCVTVDFYNHIAPHWHCLVFGEIFLNAIETDETKAIYC